MPRLYLLSLLIVLIMSVASGPASYAAGARTPAGQSQEALGQCAQAIVGPPQNPAQLLQLLRTSVPQLVPVAQEERLLTGWCALILGTLEGRSANWHEAETAFAIALAQFEAIQDWQRQATTLNNWGMLLSMQQRYDQALVQLRRSQEILADAQARGLPQDFTRSKRGRTACFRSSGRRLARPAGA